MIVEPGSTRIGWIGLGVMGRSMCAHVIDAGFSATVYTRTRETAESVLVCVEVDNTYEQSSCPAPLLDCELQLKVPVTPVLIIGYNDKPMSALGLRKPQREVGVEENQQSDAYSKPAGFDHIRVNLVRDLLW